MKELLQQLILAPLGLKESILPEPEPLSNMELHDPETEEVIVDDLPGCYPDLWEMRLLGRRLYLFHKQQRRNLTVAQGEGLRRVQKGINDIFWGCLETLQKKSGSMGVCKTETGKILLVLNPREESEPKISVHSLDIGKLVREIMQKGEED